MFDPGVVEIGKETRGQVNQRAEKRRGVFTAFRVVEPSRGLDARLAQRGVDVGEQGGFIGGLRERDQLGGGRFGALGEAVLDNTPEVLPGLAGASILYDTSNVLHHYRVEQHVAASLALFASVGLLFWYILQIVISLSDRR